jgi:chromosomal replication initiator protein
VRLPRECLDLLVQEIRGSARDIESVLIQLVTMASLLKRSIDLDLTHEALATKRGGRLALAKRATPEEVIRVVASFFKASPEALRARSRRRDVLWPRQLAMYLCRKYTDASLSQIGEALGRDHPAVANAIQRVERLMLERAPRRYEVEALCQRLEGGVVDPTTPSPSSSPPSSAP